MTETQLSMKSLNGHTNEAVSASTFHIHITHISSIISCIHNAEKNHMRTITNQMETFSH